MLFSHVKISSFRAKAHQVFHWCLYNNDIYTLAITQQNVKIQRILSLTILCLELSISLMSGAMKRKNRTLLSLLWVKDLKLSHLVHWQMIAFKWLALNATSMRWIANRNCVNNSFSELCREQQMNFKNVLSPLSWRSYSGAQKKLHLQPMQNMVTHIARMPWE